REPLIDARVGVFAAHVFQFGKEAQLLANFHLLVEPAFFWQVTDAVLQRRRHRSAEQFDRPRIRRGDVDDHTNRRRLARAIRTNQTEDTAGLHFQTEIAYGGKVAEALADVIDDKRGFGYVHVLSVTLIEFVRFQKMERDSDINARCETPSTIHSDRD